MRRKLFAMALMPALLWVGYAAAESVSVPKGFALEDGHVTREGTALETEVYNAPDGLDSGIVCWSVVGSDSSEAVQEEETGVLFFGADGKCTAFIPLDSEWEYKDLVWSPDGGRLVLVTGGSRPDVFFTLFTVGDKGMEKGVEFAALIGGLGWLDPHRFVLTRIDDIRDTESGVFSVWALKFSAVLYDAAAGEETVLKEADETRSYTVQSVSEDGNTINLLELSVKSPKDWDDPEKIQERELAMDVPAAG